MTPIPLGILALSGVFASGAYDLLETTTLTTSASSVTFSGIDQSYKHLQIRGIMKPLVSRGLIMEINGATSGYATHALRAKPNTVQTQAIINSNRIDLTEPIYSAYANEFSPIIIDILDYSSTSKNTTVRAVYGVPSSSGADNWVGITSGLLTSTAALTSASLYYSGSSHSANTRFSIYGVK
jgi:hypothetical protein